MCEHLNFEADVVVERIASGVIGNDEMVYMAGVQVRCAACGTRFSFLGVPGGLSFRRPMVSPAGFELRAPIEPDGHATSMLAGDPETAFPVRQRGGQ